MDTYNMYTAKCHSMKWAQAHMQCADAITHAPMLM